MANFAKLSQVLEESVFLCYAAVKLKVIHNCLLAMFVQKVKLNEVGSRSPLEVEKRS